MDLSNLPTAHPLRTSLLVDVLRTYPSAPPISKLTFNDLLQIVKTNTRYIPECERPIEGSLDDLPPKDPRRNTPLKQLRTQFRSPDTHVWTRLRSDDRRASMTYNELPALQRYQYLWRIKP